MKYASEFYRRTKDAADPREVCVLVTQAEVAEGVHVPRTVG